MILSGKRLSLRHRCLRRLQMEQMQVITSEFSYHQEEEIGVGQIHISGLIQFDVKPSNILFSDIGEAIVADFGQAKPATSHGTTPVPPMYFRSRPPETIRYRHGTSVSDIYQAGVTLFRAVN